MVKQNMQHPLQSIFPSHNYPRSHFRSLPWHSIRPKAKKVLETSPHGQLGPPKSHFFFPKERVNFTLYTICWLHGPRGQTGQRASMSLSQRYGQFSSPLMGFHKWFSEIQRSSEDLLMGFNRWFNHWICWGLGSSANLGARDHSSRRSLWVRCPTPQRPEMRRSRTATWRRIRWPAMNWSTGRLIRGLIRGF